MCMCDGEREVEGADISREKENDFPIIHAYC